MNKLLILILTSSLITGCTTLGSTPKCEPVIVQVPVVIAPPSPPVVVRPKLPIEELNSSSDNSVVAKSYAASIKSLQGYTAYLESLLDGYRVKEEGKK